MRNGNLYRGNRKMADKQMTSSRDHLLICQSQNVVTTCFYGNKVGVNIIKIFFACDVSSLAPTVYAFRLIINKIF